MGDMGELFKDLKEHSQQKRASNRETSSELLNKHKIPYQSKNYGAHLIITYNSVIIDFWPGTGMFILRNKQKTRGRGIFKLFKKLGINEK